MELKTVNLETKEELPIYINATDLFSKDNHGMMRLVFIKSGTGMVTINKKTIVFMAPSIFCLNELDEIRLGSGSAVEGRVVYFSPLMINWELSYENIRSGEDVVVSDTVYQDFFLIRPFMDRENRFIGKFDISISMEKRVEQLLNLLEMEITSFGNEFWPCRSRSFFLEILFLLQYIYTDSNFLEDIQIENTIPEINDIILYLHKNYNKKITIRELQSVFHINRTTLSEKFSRATGMSIMEYLIKLRMRIAGMLARDTFLPISEIMYRVGFSDGTYFNRTFKRYYELAPSEYRKKLNDM